LPLYAAILIIVGGVLFWVTIIVLACVYCRRHRRVLEALRARGAAQQSGIGIAQVQLQGVPMQTHGQMPAGYVQQV